MSGTDSDRAAHLEQRDRLFAAGLLVPTGTEGLYGRSGVFEDIVSALERLVLSAGADQDANIVRFPPVISRSAFEKSDYLRSFPNLTGSVHTFRGDDRDHQQLLRLLESGGDWTAALVSADTALCPAACHPLYATIKGPMPAGGRRWNVYGYVFRYEPSVDPARLLAFRQYEYVLVGEPDQAVAHRDTWLQRAVGLLGELGLDVVAEVANDPFFGRAGRMLAANQREENLKYEVLAPTSGAATLTAIASANCHEDHFGAAFSILTETGVAAHSACVGFGVERITLALLWAHGLDPERWPASLKHRLWSAR